MRTAREGERNSRREGQATSSMEFLKRGSDLRLSAYLCLSGGSRGGAGAEGRGEGEKKEKKKAVGDCAVSVHACICTTGLAAITASCKHLGRPLFKSSVYQLDK